ncbi:MAG TPA: alpha-glucan family phosphorylase [Bacteroidia bacterium]|jgi:phosphorylase/glycogen(starch) synthase|nr:alpha-glucan family phosphorylase [Bacteroidia bacterium]
MDEKGLKPDYIFEISWEVCNKVGGIHTVISTKALTLVNEWEDRLIMIGPDTWKGTAEHPEFAEDNDLFKSWKNHAASIGLKIRIGRWKITGNPIAILIDFTPLFHRKDDIFRDLWLRYKVDSLSGQWDYIEPALFGYAAGMVIECFYHHYLTFSDKIIAQFHEWMTGAGLLYLEEHVPQIGTVFTTHATVVGRSIAGNGLPLYSKFNSYNGDQEARAFNVVSKHSLEKISAANADCFTTVSEITARECSLFLEKNPDIITPNGFENFIVPDSFFFKEKRTLARKKLLKVASALCGEKLPEDSLLLIKSGRYEFRNKGIDLFIDALGELNRNTDLNKNVVAFICIPAHHTGPRKGLLEQMESGVYRNRSSVLTHYLQGADTDPILNRIRQNELDNGKKTKVKTIFVPVYLSGDDGIFNMHYYDLLIGFDLSAFPSYYEPWGYTPLESLAFHIPTVTTNLTGFGMIVPQGLTGIEKGIVVIDRNDNNDLEVVHMIAATISKYSALTATEINAARDAASDLSKKALWKNHIEHYKKAYSIALQKTEGRAHRFRHEAGVQSFEACEDVEMPQSGLPEWKKIFVKTQLPERLKMLETLSKNLWWSWNDDAQELFESIDKEAWHSCLQNPIVLLNILPFAELKRMEQDKDFTANLDAVAERFSSYMDRPRSSAPHIAYFCMEYGLDANLKLYSGGLGILAGDYLKEASDAAFNVSAVGLLYRNGYFRQIISPDGEQVEAEEILKFTNLPLQPLYGKDGSWLKISIAFPGRTLYAKAWKVEVGRVNLYLLDTDISENRTEDRMITGQLYGGDDENRLKQELLLGIGGVRLLYHLGLKPDVYHYNEGHAAFAGLELLRMRVQEDNISFEEALEVVRSSSLFTTHTPVPAGHDVFSEDLLRAYLSHHATLFNISWKKFIALGHSIENDVAGKFSMSYLAVHLSQEMNAVSKIHEKITRRIFSNMWNGFGEEELKVGHVTNGVHYGTWTAPAWKRFHENTFGKNFSVDPQKFCIPEKLNAVADQVIWDIHLELKRALIAHVREKVIARTGVPMAGIKKASRQSPSLNDKTLIIGFARRFVPYKRAALLFEDTRRLAAILRNEQCPVLFLFAGKTHPRDLEGKKVLQEIIRISQLDEFAGHVIFIEDYDMNLARKLVQGVDIWLNTPEMTMEASGTSGMKAALNGALNFSVPDGWWAEAFSPEVGWKITSSQELLNYKGSNQMDAESIYQTLEEEIIPLFIDRDKDGIPSKWISKIRNAMIRILPQFTTTRMLNEYLEKYYRVLAERSARISQDDFAAARRLASWKLKVTREWEDIAVINSEVYDSTNKAFPLGEEFTARIVLDLHELAVKDIGVEIVFINKRKPGETFGSILFKKELSPVVNKNKQVTYECKMPMTLPGVFEYGFRIFPKNELLPNPLDFPLLKWV